jgi:hypothetical protein
MILRPQNSEMHGPTARSKVGFYDIDLPASTTPKHCRHYVRKCCQACQIPKADNLLKKSQNSHFSPSKAENILKESQLQKIIVTLILTRQSVVSCESHYSRAQRPNSPDQVRNSRWYLTSISAPPMFLIAASILSMSSMTPTTQ